MAFTKNYNELFGTLLVLSALLSTTSAVDCQGKSFHCVNSTHFMICVDLGGGVSQAIDDFYIACPPPTVCQGTNHFECEFPAPTTPAKTLSTVISETTLSWEEIVTVSSIDNTTKEFSENYVDTTPGYRTTTAEEYSMTTDTTVDITARTTSEDYINNKLNVPEIDPTIAAETNIQIKQQVLREDKNTTKITPISEDVLPTVDDTITQVTSIDNVIIDEESKTTPINNIQTTTKRTVITDTVTEKSDPTTTDQILQTTNDPLELVTDYPYTEVPQYINFQNESIPTKNFVNESSVESKSFQDIEKLNFVESTNDTIMEATTVRIENLIGDGTDVYHVFTATPSFDNKLKLDYTSFQTDPPAPTKLKGFTTSNLTTLTLSPDDTVGETTAKPSEENPSTTPYSDEVSVTTDLPFINANDLKINSIDMSNINVLDNKAIMILENSHNNEDTTTQNGVFTTETFESGPGSEQPTKYLIENVSSLNLDITTTEAMFTATSNSNVQSVTSQASLLMSINTEFGEAFINENIEYTDRTESPTTINEQRLTTNNNENYANENNIIPISEFVTKGNMPTEAINIPITNFNTQPMTIGAPSLVTNAQKYMDTILVEFGARTETTANGEIGITNTPTSMNTQTIMTENPSLETETPIFINSGLGQAFIDIPVEFTGRTEPPTTINEKSLVMDNTNKAVVVENNVVPISEFVKQDSVASLNLDITTTEAMFTTISNSNILSVTTQAPLHMSINTELGKASINENIENTDRTESPITMNEERLTTNINKNFANINNTIPMSEFVTQGVMPTEAINTNTDINTQPMTTEASSLVTNAQKYMDTIIVEFGARTETTANGETGTTNTPTSMNTQTIMTENPSLETETPIFIDSGLGQAFIDITVEYTGHTEPPTMINEKSLVMDNTNKAFVVENNVVPISEFVNQDSVSTEPINEPIVNFNILPTTTEASSIATNTHEFNATDEFAISVDQATTVNGEIGIEDTSVIMNTQTTMTEDPSLETKKPNPVDRLFAGAFPNKNDENSARSELQTTKNDQVLALINTVHEGNVITGAIYKPTTVINPHRSVTEVASLLTDEINSGDKKTDSALKLELGNTEQTVTSSKGNLVNRESGTMDSPVIIKAQPIMPEVPSLEKNTQQSSGLELSGASINGTTVTGGPNQNQPNTINQDTLTINTTQKGVIVSTSTGILIREDVYKSTKIYNQQPTTASPSLVTKTQNSENPKHREVLFLAATEFGTNVEKTAIKEKNKTTDASANIAVNKTIPNYPPVYTVNSNTQFTINRESWITDYKQILPSEDIITPTKHTVNKEVITTETVYTPITISNNYQILNTSEAMSNKVANLLVTQRPESGTITVGTYDAEAAGSAVGSTQLPSINTESVTTDSIQNVATSINWETQVVKENHRIATEDVSNIHLPAKGMRKNKEPRKGGPLSLLENTSSIKKNGVTNFVAEKVAVSSLDQDKQLSENKLFPSVEHAKDVKQTSGAYDLASTDQYVLNHNTTTVAGDTVTVETDSNITGTAPRVQSVKISDKSIVNNIMSSENHVKGSGNIGQNNYSNDDTFKNETETRNYRISVTITVPQDLPVLQYNKQNNSHQIFTSHQGESEKNAFITPGSKSTVDETESNLGGLTSKVNAFLDKKEDQNPKNNNGQPPFSQFESYPNKLAIKGDINNEKVDAFSKNNVDLRSAGANTHVVTGLTPEAQNGNYQTAETYKSVTLNAAATSNRKQATVNDVDVTTFALGNSSLTLEAEITNVAYINHKNSTFGDSSSVDSVTTPVLGKSNIITKASTSGDATFNSTTGIVAEADVPTSTNPPSEKHLQTYNGLQKSSFDNVPQDSRGKTYASSTVRVLSQSVTQNPILRAINDAAIPYNCINGIRGRFSDKEDCRKFYICVGNDQPIVGNCPENTVFSELKKLCTKNLSHCIRENEFKCPSAGRFSDFVKDNVYYICVNHKNHLYRFKFQCQSDYVLNKTTVKCVESKEIESNESVSISSADNRSQAGSTSSSSSSANNNSITSTTRKRGDSNSSDSSNTKKSKEAEETPEETEGNERKTKEDDDEDEVFKCKKEGKFPIRHECRRYYLCKKKGSQYRRKVKKCDSGSVFHKDKKKCVDADSYEC